MTARSMNATQEKNTAAVDMAAQPKFLAQLLEQLIPEPVAPADLEGHFLQFKKSHPAPGRLHQAAHGDGLADVLTPTNGMDDPNRNGIYVPKWKR